MPSFGLHGVVELTGRGIDTTFDDLTRRTQEAIAALGRLEQAAAPEQAAARLRLIGREMDTLRAKARGGMGAVTVADIERFQALRGEAQALKSGMADLSGAFRLNLQNVTSLIYAVQGLAATFGAFQVAATVSELARLGAESEAVGRIYANLARNMGVDSDRLVEAMSNAARGTVDATTIMKIANRAFLAGGAEFATELPRLFEIARAASLATGQDVGFVFDTLTKGIAKASPMLIDNAEIYIKVGAAVDAYARSLGKTANELTFAERKTAILNAVLDQGATFIGQMGDSGELAADKLQSLGASLANLKSAIGEGVVEAGYADRVSELAASIDRLTEAVVNARIIARHLDEVGDASQRVGEESDGIARFADQMDRLAGRLFGIESAYDALNAAAEEMPRSIAGMTRQAIEGLLGLETGALDRLPPKARLVVDSLLSVFDVGDALKRTTSDWFGVLDETASSMEETAGSSQALAQETGFLANRMREAARATEQADALLEAYQAALGEVAAKSTTTTAAAEQIGQAVGQLRAAVEGIAATMPRLDLTAPLAADTEAIRLWLEETARANPALRSVAAAALSEVEALRQAQAAQIAAAMGASTAAEALDALARGSLGAGASLIDLVAKFRQLPAPVQQAIIQLNGLTAAMDALQRQAAAPIAVDVALGGFQRSMRDVDTLTQRLAAVTDVETATRVRERWLENMRGFWQRAQGLTEWEAATLNQIEMRKLEEGVANYEAAYRQRESAQRKSLERVRMTAAEFSSQVEAALRMGVQVTPLDMALTNAGQYEDKALESARRLAAIAERGFEELKVHPDWAEALKIPPEVLAGGEEMLKAWAAQTRQDVESLARPDLINWDAFVAQFQRMREQEAARGLTIDIALEKLRAAGIELEGSPEEQRQKIAEQLGLAAPSITVESFFKVPEDSQTILLQDLTKGLGYIEVPVRPVWADLGVAGAGSAAGAMGSVGGALDLATQAMDQSVGQQGGNLASSLFSGFSVAVTGFDFGGATLSAASLGLQQKEEEFKAVGEGAGRAVAAGVADGVREGTGNLKRIIAEAVAPEVADILEARQRGKGEVP